jgi:selenium metabolism protein YedF
VYMLVDARGLGCPKPVIRAEEELSRITHGIIEVLVDDEFAAENLVTFAGSNGFYSETAKEGKDWRVKLVKGDACHADTPTDLESPKKEEERMDKDILLIVGTDSLGKEEELGKILVKGFFETMKVTKEIPHTIFFLNAGVKLTTMSEEVIPVLEDLEAMGVEIFSCGTCLKYYGLESEMKVGYRGTTNHVVEGLRDFKKVVWI